MARQEQDREDILREAAALVERAELQVAGFAEPIVVGFRRDGCASFYFGGEPVLQFNTAGEMRRAFVDGRMIKAEGGRLISFTRERSPTETALVRHELTVAEAERLKQAAAEHLSRLAAAEWIVVRQIPADTEIVGRIRTWLTNRPAEVKIAAVPNAR